MVDSGIVYLVGFLARAAIAAVCLVPLQAAAQEGIAPRPIPPERMAELGNLLEQDCGSCHGLQRAGGLGPPLTAALLGERDRYGEKSEQCCRQQDSVASDAGGHVRFLLHSVNECL